MIRNIQLKHSGKYVCVVQTAVESVSSAANLTVRGKRPAPRPAIPVLPGRPVRRNPPRASER